MAVRTLHLEAIRNDAATSGYAHDLAALGANVRVAPFLPTGCSTTAER